HRSPRRRAQARFRSRRAAGPGRGRGQHPARDGGERAGHGSRVRRLYGHARHRDQRPRPAGHPREEGGRHAGDDRDPHGVDHPARGDGQGSGGRARRHDRPMTPTTPLLADHVKQAKHSMDKAVDDVKREFSKVRTGKATTALLDLVRVEAYGSEMPLNQVASVAAPEPKLLTIQPWDKALLKAVEKAILASDLGLTPSNDGNLIRIPLPPLTEERRRELVKVVHKFAEQGRVAVRHARTDAIGKIKKTEHVSEDEKKHTEKDIQKLHDDHLRQVHEPVKAKEAEIMEV